MSTAKPSLFCFGIGYTGRFVLEACLAEGFAVSGTCRRPEQRVLLEQMDAQIFLFDDAHPIQAISDALRGVTHLLVSIPPDTKGDVVLRHHAQAIASCDSLKWIGYLSTTGVYGDYQGAWVDERSELRPGEPRLERRVVAEKEWLELGAHVFRLAGIYGPGRNAAEQLLAGEARRIDKPGQFFSRIHVEDIAGTVLASMKMPNTGNVYNVCDDEPAPASDVVAYAAQLLGMEAPPLIPYGSAELSEMGRSFYSSNRRVRNTRIKDELGVRLKFPSYREGLQAIVAELKGGE